MRKKKREQEQRAGDQAMEIRAHPSQIDDQEETGIQGNRVDENISIEEIHRRIQAFVKAMLPDADLITNFNGNFMYLIPNEGFNASQVYQ